MKQNRRRILLVVGPYLLVVVTSFGGFLQLERDRDHACHQRASDRNVLRQVVDVATTPSSGRVDLSRIAGFEDLDPAVQQYLRNLSAALSSVGAPDQKPLHDRLIELLPPIKC